MTFLSELTERVCNSQFTIPSILSFGQIVSDCVPLVATPVVVMMVRHNHHRPLDHGFVHDGSVRDSPMHNRPRRPPHLAHRAVNDRRGMMDVLGDDDHPIMMMMVMVAMMMVVMVMVVVQVGRRAFLILRQHEASAARVGDLQPFDRVRDRLEQLGE